MTAIRKTIHSQVEQRLAIWRQAGYGVVAYGRHAYPCNDEDIGHTDDYAASIDSFDAYKYVFWSVSQDDSLFLSCEPPDGASLTGLHALQAQKAGLSAAS